MDAVNNAEKLLKDAETQYFYIRSQNEKALKFLFKELKKIQLNTLFADRFPLTLFENAWVRAKRNYPAEDADTSKKSRRGVTDIGEEGNKEAALQGESKNSKVPDVSHETSVPSSDKVAEKGKVAFLKQLVILVWQVIRRKCKSAVKNPWFDR